MANVKTNKTAFVRNILRDIGAISTNPPDGWRQKVEAALATEKLKMQIPTIYQIRQKAMADAGIAPSARGRKKSVSASGDAAVAAVAVAKPAVKKVVKPNANLNADQLIAVQKLAKQLGGTKNLKNLCDVLDALQS